MNYTITDLKSAKAKAGREALETIERELTALVADVGNIDRDLADRLYLVRESEAFRFDGTLTLKDFAKAETDQKLSLWAAWYRKVLDPHEEQSEGSLRARVSSLVGLGEQRATLQAEGSETARAFAEGLTTGVSRKLRAAQSRAPKGTALVDIVEEAAKAAKAEERSSVIGRDFDGLYPRETEERNLPAGNGHEEPKPTIAEALIALASATEPGDLTASNVTKATLRKAVAVATQVLEDRENGLHRKLKAVA